MSESKTRQRTTVLSDTSLAESSLTLKQSGAFPFASAAACLLFLCLMFVNEWGMKTDIQAVFALWAAIIAVFSFIQPVNRKLLLDAPTPILVILFAQLLLYFIGLFYAVYSKFALQTFCLNAGAFLIFCVLYVNFRRNEKNIRFFMTLAAAAVALASLVSMELASSRYLIGLFNGLGSLFGATLPDNYGGFEANTRLTSIIGNPNIFAPLTVLGLFAALYSAGKPGSRGKQSFFNAFLAGICAAAFILTFSLGTILAYGAAFVVFLIVTKKGSRADAFISHILALLFAVVAAALFFILKDKSVLPLFTVVALSLAFAFLYTWMKPVKLPAWKKTTVLIVIAAVVLAAAALIACALFLRKPYELGSGEFFRRAVRLEPGSYSLSVTSENGSGSPDATATVETMSYTQAALKEKSTAVTANLKSGGPVNFSVPDSTAAVFITVTAGSPVTVGRAEITGADGTVRLPLKYVLIPEFIVNRLQGLWANDNAIQRFVFFKDGLRMGASSPVYGFGGGAFEGKLFGTADYYYQTKHPHNELIQRFVDGGAIGVLLFAGTVYLVFRALVKRKKNDESGRLYPQLFALALFIFVHSMIEVDFLSCAYRIFAYGIFAAAAYIGAETFELRKGAKASGTAVFYAALLATLLLTFGHVKAVKLASAAESLDDLSTAAAIDPFNSSDYKLSYILSSMSANDPKISAKAQKYLASIEKGTVNPDSTQFLVQYYLTKPNPDADKAVLYAEYGVRTKRVSPEAWDTVFSIYQYALTAQHANTQVCAAVDKSILSLCDYIEDLNRTLPKKTVPALAASSYIRAKCLESGSALMLDSRVPCDLDLDGKPDLVKSEDGGKINWQFSLYFAGETRTIKIYQKEGAANQVFVGGEAFVPVYDASAGCYSVNVTPKAANTPVTIQADATAGVYFTIG